MHSQGGHHGKHADHCRPEEALAQHAGDAEHVRQIPIGFEDELVVVPGLARPEPDPTRTPNECANDHHRQPQHDKAEEEGPNGELPLLVGVIAVPQRVGIHVGNHHEPHQNQGRQHHAGHPGIEIDQHLLQPQKVPGRFCRVHGQGGIGRLFQRRIQGNRPHHQNEGDDDGNQKLHAQQVGPDLNFPSPARFPGLRLAVVGLGHLRVGFQPVDQPVVGERLPEAVPGVKRDDQDEQDDWNIVGQGGDFPELNPIH